MSFLQEPALIIGERQFSIMTIVNKTEVVRSGKTPEGFEGWVVTAKSFRKLLVGSLGSAKMELIDRVMGILETEAMDASGKGFVWLDSNSSAPELVNEVKAQATANAPIKKKKGSPETLADVEALAKKWEKEGYLAHRYDLERGGSKVIILKAKLQKRTFYIFEQEGTTNKVKAKATDNTTTVKKLINSLGGEYVEPQF